MHDIYYGTALPPDRTPIPILRPSDRIGVPYLRCPAEKIIAVVPTNSPDYATPSRPADADSQLIAGHVLDFLVGEVRRGRLPATLPPLQSGVGNVTNAVLAGLDGGPFRPLTAYSEVVQDGMLRLLLSGTMTMASATAFSLSRDGIADLRANIGAYRDRVILRPQEISNHPEVIRRLGCLAMNGMLEADIYGNVNSTHVRGSCMYNGIGGSGDFARNAYLAMFVPRRPPRVGRSRASCRWSAMSTTPSTTCTSSSPSRASPTCGACRRGAAPSRSSTTAHTPATGPRCRTTSTAPPPPDPASTPSTCWARHCPGTCGTCTRARCDPPETARAAHRPSTGPVRRDFSRPRGAG
jgi:Acetyl-CoA hydrolase/transferase C-terminal domain